METRSAWSQRRARWKQRLSAVAGRTRNSEAVANLGTIGFSYTPLDPDRREIRVLKLRKSCNLAKVRKPLEFDLVTIRLGDEDEDDQDVSAAPVYYAISYAWEQDPQLVPMFLNDQRAMVPDSSAEALRGVLSAMHKANLQNISYMWIDAVCINQADKAEKSHQVAMMGDVFSRAQGCLVWWGDDDGTTASISKTLKLLHDDCSGWIRSDEGSDEHLRYNAELDIVDQEKLPYWNSRLPGNSTKSDLRALLSCRWFSRLWVVQEVSLAKARYCFRGSYYIPWSIFSLASRWMFHRGWLWDADPRLDISLANLSFISEQIIFRDAEFQALLGLNLSLHTSEAHDSVFALLGVLASQEKSALPAVDYGRRLQDVFADTTYLAMSSESSLRLLHFLMASNGHVELLDPDWPSWVPRYHLLNGEMVRNSFVATSNAAENACNGVPLRIAHISGSGILQVDGVSVSAVSTIHALSSAPVVTSRNGDSPRVVRPPVLAAVLRLIDPEFLGRFDLSLSRDTMMILATILPQGNEHYELAENALKDFAALSMHAMKSSGFRDDGLEQLLLACGAESGDARSFSESLSPSLTTCNLFRLSSGEIGRSTSMVKEGDVVCILFGLNTPVVLRREGEHWTLSGEAYVPGVSDGGYIRRLQDEGRLYKETQTFYIK